jgi:hypothetical protein
MEFITKSILYGYSCAVSYRLCHIFVNDACAYLETLLNDGTAGRIHVYLRSISVKIY